MRGVCGMGFEINLEDMIPFAGDFALQPGRARTSPRKRKSMTWWKEQEELYNYSKARMCSHHDISLR